LVDVIPASKAIAGNTVLEKLEKIILNYGSLSLPSVSKNPIIPPSKGSHKPP
jgi:hypothetical protein